MHSHAADDRDRSGKGIDGGPGGVGVRAGDPPPDRRLRDPDKERRPANPSVTAVVEVPALELKGEDLNEASQREDDEV